jgi:hypothetical protein
MVKEVPINFQKHEGLWLPTGYKVLTKDLVSVGLRNCPEEKRLEYVLNDWTNIEEEFTPDNADSGGLWVAKRLGSARTLKKYMWDKHGIETRIFDCLAGQNYFDVSSYRFKTDKIMLVEEYLYNYP